MTAVLAADGGQGTLRVGATGAPVAEAPGLRRRDSPGELAAAIIALWRQLGSPSTDTVALGLSMLPAQPADRASLAEALLAETGARRVMMADDGITAHLGALPRLEGTALTAGTGVACTSWMPGHPVTVVDGAGFLLGDDGGGFWIGREGLRAVLRAHDGRGPATLLSSLAEARFGDIGALADRIHEDPRPADTIAGFARAVMQHPDDPVAADIIAQAADALRETVATAARRTGAATVTLGGGALTPGSPLHRAVHTRLTADFAVRDAAGTPLDGAHRLAGDLPAEFSSHLHIYLGTSARHER